jgi:DNA polymerase-4
MPDSPGILHVDMDAFYASVEVLLDPSLRGKPVIVGGRGGRGVVAAASYEARMFGVRSAMPSGRALRLCPHAVCLTPRFDQYTEFSRRIHEVFQRYTPLVEGISLDEAFLDVRGAVRLFGPGPSIGRLIRADIRDEIGLAASVGVASTKFIAKLASEAAKPTADRRGIRPGAGVFVVEPGTELAFLHPLPVQALWGVGPATHKRLLSLGVNTVGDLAATPLASLVGLLGEAVGQHLHDLSWARDPRRVEPDRPTKSVSHEETYAVDLHTHHALGTEALRLADGVGSRLRKAALAGRTVTIKVRFHDFNTITRSRTLPEPVDDTQVIAQTATELLAAIDPGPGVRLLGVGVSNLCSVATAQLSLLDSPGTPGRTDVVVDRIRGRFGPGAVGPAALLERRSPRVNPAPPA